MKRSCTPGTEVIGQAMLSYIENIQADVILPLLEKHKLRDIQPDRWYPLQPWLDVIWDELAPRTDFESTMIAVGLKVVEFALTPPEMKHVTLGQMLEGWDIHFHANHRNGEVGRIVTEKINDKTYKTTHQHIYPDGLNYGLAYGFARQILPKGTPFKVEYEDYNYRLDRGGADKTVIIVSWE